MNDTNRPALSDYEANLATAINHGFVTGRSIGLVASVFAYYERTMERERMAAAEANSVHVGTVGERAVFKLTLVSTRSFEGQFGLTVIHKFLSAEGNVVTWFASGGSDFKEGETYDIKGTVKKHDEFRGVKQTVLSRCALHIEKVKKPRAKKASPAQVALPVEPVPF